MDKAERERLKAKQALEQAYDVVASFDAGREVLRHIMLVSGYQDHLKTVSPATGELNIHATTYNLSKRDVWVDIRPFLSAHNRREIENPLEPVVKAKPPKANEEADKEQELEDAVWAELAGRAEPEGK